jgi:hypothetical protein
MKIVKIDPIEDSIQEKIQLAYNKIRDVSDLPLEFEQALKKARYDGLFRTTIAPINLAIDIKNLLYKQLLELLPQTTLRHLGVQVAPLERVPSAIEIQVRSLEYVSPFKYRSPLRPTIKVDDKDLSVVYHLRDDDHFTRRLEERTVRDPSNPLCKDQVFGFLYYCCHFDLVSLPNGQLAARLWNWCDPDIPLSGFWNEVLGDSCDVIGLEGMSFFCSNEGLAYYLVGYCPIDEQSMEKGIAVLNTLLLPGMDNTPEFRATQRGMSTTERVAFQQRVLEMMTMKNLTDTKDFSLLREFHRHVPQVRMIKEKVFRYGDR